MDVVNCGAVIVSAIAAFILGGIWYSPKVFGKIWAKHARVSPMQSAARHSIFVYISAFIFFLISAYVFAIFIGPAPTIDYSLTMGFAAGIGFAATSFGINYTFAKRGISLFFIDGGYHTAQFVLYGLILGLWH